MTRYWRLLVFGLCLLAMHPGPAAADGSMRMFTVQLSARGDRTVITLDLNRPMQFRTALDGQGGGRVTVDFSDLKLNPDRTIARGIGLVRSYHAEPLAGGGVRLVLDLARPAIVASARPIGSRAVIELGGSTLAAMRASTKSDDQPDIADQPSRIVQDSIGSLIEPPGPHILRLPAALATQPKPQVPQPKNLPPPPMAEAPVVAVAAVTNPLPALTSAGKQVPSIESIIAPKRIVVIDAGHGGIDPGAESVAGYHEKEITLATARLLRKALEQTGRYKVVLTRDSDVYLKLHERVARARAAHGNLFISLHADSAVADRTTRGASIYTLSETASDAESERYAQQENRADAIGGVDLGDQSDDVAGILVDLTVRETVNDGNRLANMMSAALEHQGVPLLPTAPHRSAGFAVLKSPDIPSILIEMGYLSDMSDARALADPKHQQRIASAITEGVDRYFAWLQVSRS